MGVKTKTYKGHTIEARQYSWRAWDAYVDGICVSETGGYTDDPGRAMRRAKQVVKQIETSGRRVY